jgi:hypothetical protein
MENMTVSPSLTFFLVDNTPCSFFILYHSLCSQLSATQFHPDFLPDLSYIKPFLDLTHLPVDAQSLPPVCKEHGGCVYPLSHWDNEHQRLGGTLYMTMNSNKMLANSPPGLDALNTHNIAGDGFAVLQELLVRHHPRHHQMLAPCYNDICTSAPMMAVQPRDSDLFTKFSKYLTAFDVREIHLLLYYESKKVLQTSEFVLAFVTGIDSRVKCFITLETADVLQFQRAHRGQTPEPSLSRNLLVDALSARISVCLKDTVRSSTTLARTTARTISRVAAIHLNDSFPLILFRTNSKTGANLLVILNYLIN